MPFPFSLARKKKHTKEPEIFDNEEQGERQVLTTVYRAENPVIDIVAVHGLNGDAIKSFTSGKNQKFWLGDTDMLPGDLANSRILTFSYPASVAAVFGKTSSETILQHATTLVHELVADRQMDKAMERPIVFLCHSLGGIIVKRALIYSETRKSKAVEHIHSIFVSTYGILFFGTPHQGSSKANLATFVQRMVATLPSKLVDTDSTLLDALVEGSETLQDITDNFQPKMKRFHVFFFWEQAKSDLGVKMDYVVTDFSAAPILDGTERAGLPADHRNMCKFAARTSPGYNLVVATLRRYADGAPSTISRRWVETKELFTSLRRNEVRDLYEGLE